MPRKNLKDFRGKPMLVRALEVVRRCGLFNLIIVSTDDNEIATIAKQENAIVHWRATDDGTKGTQDVASDVIDAMVLEDAEAVCVLYPCVPLLTAWDLSDSFWRWKNSGFAFCVSVSVDRLADAGAFYWCKTAALVRRLDLYMAPTMTYGIEPNRCIDINTPEDWTRAEEMYDALQPKPL